MTAPLWGNLLQSVSWYEISVSLQPFQYTNTLDIDDDVNNSDNKSVLYTEFHISEEVNNKDHTLWLLIRK